MYGSLWSWVMKGISTRKSDFIRTLTEPVRHLMFNFGRLTPRNPQSKRLINNHYLKGTNI